MSYQNRTRSGHDPDIRRVQIPLKPCQLCDRVRQILGLLVTDRTIRRWRAEAFIDRKKFYTEQEAQTIARYASLLMQMGDISEARIYFAEHNQEDHDETQCIDVTAQEIS